MAGQLLPLLVVIISVLMLRGDLATAADPNGRNMLPSKFRKLLPLHTKLGSPQPGDWLDQHAEPGQTFRQYVRSRPVKPTDERRVIYVQPLGQFSKTQRKIIDRTAEFLKIYFGLPVKVREDLPLNIIPDEARRTHPTWGDKQILTTYVLDKVLRPRLPKDACVMLAFTTSDLWPGQGWNYVFGQALLQKRVGVWSIHRNGDPHTNDKAYGLCLRRTLKTATHETGHMFSMTHCTLFECNMCGCNHLDESDRLPVALCPHCLAKLAYATDADIRLRFIKLITFCKANGLKREQAFWEKSLAAFKQ